MTGLISLGFALVTAVLGGAVGAWCQARSSRKSEDLKQKRDVFRRFFGNRHRFSDQDSAEPLVSLNEVFIVFADSPSVLSAWEKFHAESGRPDCFHSNLTTLVQALAKAADLDSDRLTHDLINRPISQRRQG